MTFNTVVAGTTITAAWGNQVRDQEVSVFASVAARDSAITAPVSGMYATTTDTGWLWRYNGSKWLREPVTIIKTTETTFTTNTTLADDATLQFPVDASASYEFVFNILWLANTTVQYKHCLTFPAAARMDYGRVALTSAGAIFSDALANKASGFTLASGSTGGDTTGQSLFTGILVNGVNAGSVVLQAAQNSSSATAAQTLRGSSIRYRQVA